MKKSTSVVVFFFFLLALVPAWLSAQETMFEDFEDGIDHQPVVTSIEGLEFVNTSTYWIYGDWRTGSWNGPYPDGTYYSEGNFFAILEGSGTMGTIQFTDTLADWVQVGYCSHEIITMFAYDENDNLLDSVDSIVNTSTGQLDYLRIDAEGIAYVTMVASQNYWMIDNFEADAFDWECELNTDCDDGVFCNGKEYCEDHECKKSYSEACPSDGLFCNGTEACNESEKKCKATDIPKCTDDGYFCNGDEYCNEQTDSCSHAGNPCEELEVCNDATDSCDLDLSDDDDDQEDDDSDEKTDNDDDDDDCGS